MSVDDGRTAIKRGDDSGRAESSVGAAAPGDREEIAQIVACMISLRAGPCGTRGLPCACSIRRLRSQLQWRLIFWPHSPHGWACLLDNAYTARPMNRFDEINVPSMWQGVRE